MTVRGTRSVVLLALAAALVAGCERGEPAPAPSPSPSSEGVPSPPGPSGLSVAFVIPADAARPAAVVSSVREDLDRLRRSHLRDVTDWRVVEADAPAFTADLVTYLADEGTDLVCAIGPGSGDVVVRVAPSFPRTRFCATPAIAEADAIPGNVLLIDLRVEEVAYLAGVAAQLTATTGPPGFVGGESQYSIDRQRAAFQAGINAVAATPVTPYVAFPVVDADQAFALAVPQYEAGVATIYSAAGSADVGVRRAAQETGGLVIGSLATLVPDPSEPPPTAVLMVTQQRLDVGAGIAVEQALTSWEGGLASVGLAQRALDVGPGGSGRYGIVAPRIEELRARIEADELRPLSTG